MSLRQGPAIAPVSGPTSTVSNRNDVDAFVIVAKHNDEGESPKHGPPSLWSEGGKLLRKGGDPKKSPLQLRKKDPRGARASVRIPADRNPEFIGGLRVQPDRPRDHFKSELSLRRTSGQGIAFTAPRSSSSVRRLTSIIQASSTFASVSESKLSIKELIKSARSSCERSRASRRSSDAVLDTT